MLPEKIEAYFLELLLILLLDTLSLESKGIPKDWKSYIHPETLERDLGRDFRSWASDRLFQGDIDRVSDDGINSGKPSKHQKTSRKVPCTTLMAEFGGDGCSRIPEAANVTRNGSLVNAVEDPWEKRYDHIQSALLLSLNNLPYLRDPTAGNVISGEETRWPKGVLPYNISDIFSSDEKKLIKGAMSVMSAMTFGCITFVERTDQIDYVYILRGVSCYSSVGRQGGRQDISLKRGCLEMGSIQHEIMHALGFYHEMSRDDRDNHLWINWENISEKEKQQFQTFVDADTLETPYDYESVMQYPFNAFAIDKNFPTMVPKKKGSRLGQTINLSLLDALRIQKAYSCGIPDPARFEDEFDQGFWMKHRWKYLQSPEESRSRGLHPNQNKKSYCGGLTINKRAEHYPITTDGIYQAPAADDRQPIAVNSQLFPSFLFKPMSLKECSSLNPSGCNCVVQHSNSCSADQPIFITGEATVKELASISSRIKDLDKSRPVRFELNDSQTDPEVFARIRKVVVSLDISSCINPLTTSKLPRLMITNLLHFGLVRCNNMQIQRQDFAQNLKLRFILFYQSTIQFLETNAFGNLPELKHLSLEWMWESITPFTNEYVDHILRFHCRCEYLWFRKWLRLNPVLISPKKESEVYRLGEWKSWATDRKATFFPVDCTNQEIDEDTEYDKSQYSYSTNDNKCD